MGSTLLVQSCSNRKRDAANRLPALERYDGYFFRIIKKAIDDGALRNDIDIMILSAEFGLLDTGDLIPMYDRKMTIQRAEELRNDVVNTLVSRIERSAYDELVINMGSEYEHAIRGVNAELKIDITRIEGEGIGEKGSKLKQFIRSDSSVQEVEI